MEAYSASPVRASTLCKGSRFSSIFGPNVSDVTLSFTSWKHSHHVTGGLEICAPFSSLVARLRHEATHGTGAKKNAPLWAPIACHGFAYDKDVSHITALVLDYDAGSLDLQTASQQLQESGLAFLLHDSPSATSTHHKWRLVLPLSTPVLPTQWNQLYLAAARLVGAYLLPPSESFDLSCHNPAHRWFFPWRRDKQQPLRRVLSGEGATFDIEKLAAPIHKPKLVIHKQTSPFPLERTDATERARRYLGSMDAAISGQGGHNQTFRAARTLVLDFNIDTETAFQLLRDDFNPRCVPPWSDKELRHKVESANKLQGQRGKLFAEPRRNELTPKTTVAPQPTKRAELPQRYAAQLEQAKQKKDQAPKAFTREEAAPHILQAAKDGLTQYGELRVVVVPCAGGKSQAALELVKEWQGDPIALLVKEHDLGEDLRLRAQALGLDAVRYHSPPGEGGPRRAPREGQRKGDLLCTKPRSTVLAHILARTNGKKICQGCPDFDNCAAKEGRIGPANARLHIAPDQSPNYALTHAKHLIKDEWPELLRTHRATIEGLRLLALGNLSLMPETRRVLKDVALDVLQWHKAGQPKDQDPLTKHKEDLHNLQIQDDGRRSSELARDPDYRPNKAQEHAGALAYHASWEAGTTLIEAAMHGATLEFVPDSEAPAFVWYGKSPVAEALNKVQSAVILTATPGDLKALEKATGKKVVVTHINIKPVAPIEHVWKPDTNATRRGYIDKHGRPRFIDAKKTPLAQHILDTTQWIQERPLISSFLLSTYKHAAIGIRLAWARFKDQLPDPDDELTWKKLHGNGTEAAVQKALKALAPLFELLRERNITLDVIWYHAGAGLNHWRQEGKAFNACATLGNPNPSVDEHRRRYAEARGLDLEQLPDDDPKWQREYDRSAGNEATQQHGRIGDVGRPQDEAAWHLHIGKTLPTEWDENTVSAYRAPGRPKQQEPQTPGFDWREALQDAIAQVGSLPKLARALQLNERVLRRYLSGERVPTQEALAKLRSDGLARGGIAEEFRAVGGRTETTIASRSDTLLDSNYGPGSKGRGTPPWLARISVLLRDFERGSSHGSACESLVAFGPGTEPGDFSVVGVPSRGEIDQEVNQLRSIREEG
jgi:hypothetical protein